MVTRRRLLAGTAGLTAGFAASSAMASGPAYADSTVPVDPASTWGTWEGWGTSLCWWANVFGDQDVPADILFTLDTVPYDGKQLPGLGMTIARYNVGGCTWTPIKDGQRREASRYAGGGGAASDGKSMVESPNIPRWKQIEGFWLNWFSNDPASGSFDWSVDAEQRAMVKKAQAGGVDTLELFSNSPLWWMCKNHNPSGAADGGDNLQSWNYQQHARYLAIVAKYAHDNWGIDFDSVDAFNEPSAGWWKADGTQEGCTIPAGVQAQVIPHLRSELDARGLTDVAVAASDESYYDHARATWSSFGGDLRSKIGRVNVHGYQYEGGRRDLLYNDVHAAGKPLWQSEWGDGDGSGLRLARNFMLDMRWLHPTAFVYWQAFDGLEWGLIYCDENNGTLGKVNTKYYVFAQWSRHIRPGMRILTSGHNDSVAAYDEQNKRLVLVTANFDAAQQVTYDLSRFATVPDGTARRWTTTTDTGGDRYVARTDVAVSGKRCAVDFAAHTVQTIEIDGVVA